MSVSPDASSSLADDHPARIVWSCVEQQIYSDPQSARALALWLYASLQQVGSVSALALLCESDAAYAWLAGDAPFDAARLHAFRLDEGNAPLLQHNLAALLLSGVGLVSQTASVSGSEQDRFRHFLSVAEQQLQKLKRHLDDAADVFLSERALARDRARVEYENKVKASLSVLSQLFEWSKQEAARKLQAELEAKKQAEAKARAAAKEKAQREAEEAARLAAAKRKARPSRGPVVRYAPVSPWALDMAGVKRLRMTLTWAGAVFLLFSVTTMSVKPKPIDRAEAEKVSPRLAQLVMEKKVELAKRPPPVPVPPKEELKENLKEALKENLDPAKEAPKDTIAPKNRPAREQNVRESAAEAPTAAQIAAARERASSTGLLAMRDQLASLRDMGSSDSLRQQTASVGGSGTERSVERDLIGKAVAGGSGGVSGKAVAYAGGGSLQGRTAEKIKAPTGVPSLAAVEKESRGGKRGHEDIKLGFDANKSALYGIYRRALRQNPLLEGRVVLKLTIDPSGQVTACTIASSALKDPELEEKLVARVLLINFGARPGSETWTGNYHIDFVPAG